MAPSKAHDGKYDTFYSVKDKDATGNFLKLFLGDSYEVGRVVITNRLDACCQGRLAGTEVMVYSRIMETGNCGSIEG